MIKEILHAFLHIHDMHIGMHDKGLWNMVNRMGKPITINEFL